MSDGTQLFIVLFHFIIHFVHHRDGARHYLKITCYSDIYCHTELRTPLKGLVRYRCVKGNSVLKQALSSLLCTFTYTQNAVVEL